ncbi:ribosome silencing factor [Chitinophaga nivalis]|uniref:Ribosomal silencing factor RsfS n=1 Tax=Chitinophaga nivalis TaxID=2991709 RepID=A0ABT3IUD2_9BACT|nr:ribosome silencing factor [Chitinophaga nivalis]MCW3462707.1 ribosome silencing factor [Chitinophaga nivalis]MCW3487602.1 ribosome silencing factor [Chitinophaga nivalis]
MAPLTVLSTRKKAQLRLTRESEIFTTIIKAIQEKKGENIVSLDLRQIPEAVADFFILCEANSGTQVKAIADYVTEEVEKHTEEEPYKHEGFSSQQWVLVDYVNVVLHIFQPETRKFYNLEEMWSDAERMEHNDDN